MKAPPIDYVRADSVAEAVHLLEEHGGEARVLAGGQSLVPMLAMRLAQPALLVDINRIPGIGGIQVAEGVLTIGALARYSAIERSAMVRQDAPLLSDALRFVGDRLVRNRGTLVGSLAQADPSGEGPLLAVALSATVVAEGAHGHREIPVTTLVTGPYETILDVDEVIVEMRIPTAVGRRHVFVEAQRRHGDYAMVAVAAVGVPGEEPETWRQAAVTVGAVAERPIFVEVIPPDSDVPLDPATVLDAAEEVLARCDPFSDVRASAEYRVHLTRIYVRRALEGLAARWGASG